VKVVSAWMGAHYTLQNGCSVLNLLFGERSSCEPGDLVHVHVQMWFRPGTLVDVVRKEECLDEVSSKNDRVVVMHHRECTLLFQRNQKMQWKLYSSEKYDAMEKDLLFRKRQGNGNYLLFRRQWEEFTIPIKKTK
jgi:hypothetical protein